MGQYGFAKSLGIGSLSAKTFIARYFARTLALPNTCSAPKNKPQPKASSRTRPAAALTSPTSANTNARAEAERAAINTPMQGTASDLIKRAMTDVSRWLVSGSLKSKLIMQAHDELVLEAPEAKLDLVKEKLPQMMAKVNEGILKVPLIIEVGAGMNWGKTH